MLDSPWRFGGESGCLNLIAEWLCYSRSAMTPQTQVRQGMEQIEKGILDFLSSRGESWTTRSHIAKALGLESAHSKGGFPAFVSEWFLNRLVEREVVEKHPSTKPNLRYRIKHSN